jgi:hypothetical protein
MTALAADQSTALNRIRANGGTRIVIGKLAAATTVYKGALCAKNAAGYIVPAADAAGLVVVGIAQSQVVNAGVAGAAEIALLTDVTKKFANHGAALVAQANMHGPVYVQDDQTVRGTGGTNTILAGVCDQIDSDGVWVRVSPDNAL